MFDSVIRNMRNDINEGNTISGWKLFMKDIIYGNYPQLISDIITDSEKYM